MGRQLLGLGAFPCPGRGDQEQPHGGRPYNGGSRTGAQADADLTVSRRWPAGGRSGPRSARGTCRAPMRIGQPAGQAELGQPEPGPCVARRLDVDDHGVDAGPAHGVRGRSGRLHRIAAGRAGGGPAVGHQRPGEGRWVRGPGGGGRQLQAGGDARGQRGAPAGGQLGQAGPGHLDAPGRAAGAPRPARPGRPPGPPGPGAGRRRSAARAPPPWPPPSAAGAPIDPDASTASTIRLAVGSTRRASRSFGRGHEGRRPAAGPPAAAMRAAALAGGGRHRHDATDADRPSGGRSPTSRPRTEASPSAPPRPAAG